MNCPDCAAPLSHSDSEACPKCGVPLAQAPPARRRGAGQLVVAGSILLVGLLFGGVVVAAFAPGLFGGASKESNEALAVSALKRIAVGQSFFREGDEEGDGVQDYGSLEELVAARVVDSALASGTKDGYRFRCQPSPEEPELLWMAVAEPVSPGSTGDRYFAVNHEGVIFHRTSEPIPLNDACEVPADASRFVGSPSSR